MTGKARRSGERGQAGAVRLLAIGVEVLAWWALMVGLWVVTLSGSTGPEDVAAAAAGFMAAVVATSTRHVMRVGGSARLRWLAWLPVVAASAVTDTVRVLALAGRHLANRDVAGDIRPVYLRKQTDGEQPDPAAMLHRGLATLVVTSTPGSLVFDEDPDEHSVLVHSLVEGPPDLEGTVAR